MMEDQLEHRFVETNGVRLHVVFAGDSAGKPIILLHGFPEFWYGWHHQIPALVEAGFRVIIPDQRGYNLSDKPKGIRPYRLRELGRDIIGLLDYFGFAKVDLVGHDWGAGVAWWVAINFPDRIKHLGILNVPHPAVMKDYLRKSPCQMLKSWYILFFQIPGLPDWLMRLDNFSNAIALLRSSSKPYTFTEEDFMEYRKAWTNSKGLTGMINWYRALSRHRTSSPEDIRVHVPTLMLWGKRDVALSQEMAQKSIRLCDNGRLEFFEDATHWVQHDEANAVNLELIAFCK
jgi:pimeloyl-ACP methyl ester carboxylesterase